MTPLRTIGQYRVVSKLGEGGMGEVWLATDTRLHRDVAIKTLPESYAADLDRLDRFTREAQVLAGLNHPNIAAIYNVEDRALVMEYVPGPTLADRIAQSAIPLDEALPIARQIAEALEYAHDRAIVHRDLKPANIKITPEGRVKVLDFGLAKALSSETVSLDPKSSPTLTMRATLAGIIMGTPGYMSPEQAKGKPVDRRADIWAFGVLVAEMLTGRAMYTGETVSEIVASVIKDQPDLSGFPADTPPAVRRMLRRCLEKDPQRRLQAIGEARIAIDEPPSADAPTALPPIPAAPTRRGVPWWTIAVAALVPTLALGGLLWRATRPVEKPLQRFLTDLGPDAERGGNVTLAISPDGKRIAHLLQTGGVLALGTRLLSQGSATVLANSANAAHPFFSPDGQWIGFLGPGGSLYKVSIHGGAPAVLHGSSVSPGASWEDDGFIYAKVDGKISRIPENGGPPQPLANPAGDTFDDNYPHLLPGGQNLLLTSALQGRNYDAADIRVLSLKTGQYKLVQHGGYFARYTPSGHLIFVRASTLFAVPFDLGRLETRGTPVPVLDDVDASAARGGGQFDFSQDGMLAYLPAGAQTRTDEVAWMDKAGHLEKILGMAEARTPKLSPGGKQLALSVSGDLSIVDPARGSTTRLASNGGTSPGYPHWMPDGKHLIYTDGGSLYWVRADGSGKPELLLNGRNAVPQSISPDGKSLAYHVFGQGRDIYTMPLDLSDPDHAKAGQPEPFAITPLADVDPAFSPDGRWVAYASFQSNGGFQVFVRPFPAGSGGQVQISSAPGRFPLWSPVRNEIFYVAQPEGRIMVVPFTVARGVFSAGKPELWSETAIAITGVAMPLDIAPDGKRFVVFPRQKQSPDARGNLHVVFLLNFFDELRRKVP